MGAVVTADLIIACSLLMLVVLVGFKKARGADDPIERFSAGRQLHWLTLGTSLAASAMSADTALLIAGIVFMDGFGGNWFWWASAPGALATLLFFVPLWRRSGVLTEVEIFRLRYGTGDTARRYRIFQALLEGLIVNVLVIASAGYAFGLVLQSMLIRWNMATSTSMTVAVVAICLIGAAAHALVVGFRGLAKSDATEFAVAVIAASAFAVFAVAALPDGIASLQKLGTARAGGSIFAAWDARDPIGPFLLLALGWWHSAPGRGMLVQRVAASRDERSARLTVITFIVLHFLVRPWGWYMIGAAALSYLPARTDPEQALPLLAGSLLPEGLFGIVLAVTALAFMGCANSRLNYGASFIVNDVALALRPGLPTSSTRRIELATVVLLTVAALALITAGAMTSIRSLYQFLAMLSAGTGFVSIARWYWWRTSLRCEIASMITAAGVACLSLLVADISDPTHFALALAVNFLIGAAVTVIVAFAGRPTPESLLLQFHDRVSPGGPGWRRFSAASGSNLKLLGSQWLVANLALFGIVFCCIRLLALDFTAAALLLALVGLCAGTLRRLSRRPRG